MCVNEVEEREEDNKDATDDDRSSSGEENDEQGHKEADDNDCDSVSGEDSHNIVSVHAYSDNEAMSVDDVDTYTYSAHDVGGESEWGGIEEQEWGGFVNNTGMFTRTHSSVKFF